MNVIARGRHTGAIMAAVAAALALTLAAACGGGDSGAAADFTLPLYIGADAVGGQQEVRLSDFAGRPVVLNFWAPLCPPCRAEMPHFQELWEDLQARGEDAMVLGADVGAFTMQGNREQSVAFLESIHLTYPVGEAQDRAIVTDYGVLGMPTTVFIAADGSVHRTWVGAITRDQLFDVTEELLQ